MKTINVRAFKVVFPNGKIAFVTKCDDSRGSWGCDSVRSLAMNAKSDVERFFRENQGDMVQASIDLKPYHDIECPTGVAPQRCLPLTDDEASEFWDQFNAS
ncbi:MAG: hypothetical protein WCT18_03855 [Patescibacteria group bacterium]